MFGLNMSDVGWVVLVVSAGASFWVGRTVSRRLLQRKRDKEQAAARAQESRQARRARQRREGR